jgi:hypothetical protein
MLQVTHRQQADNKQPMRHGIDLKTHSQCQRTARRPKPASASQQKPFSPSSVSLSWSGGAYRDRTDDPLLAKQVLSQLS